jgi:hypothetical protein
MLGWLGLFILATQIRLNALPSNVLSAVRALLYWRLRQKPAPGIKRKLGGKAKVKIL